MVGGAANSAKGPVASGTPAGCAMAVKSIPRAAVMAASNWRSLILSTNAASGSLEPTATRTSRVALSPRASAGTVAAGFVIENAATAFVTSRSMLWSAVSVL